MRRLLLAAAMALAVPGGAAALFGLGGNPRLTILWIPSENFSGWQELDGVLTRFSDLRLTIGVSPDQLTPEARRILSDWAGKGRLELALRLNGDPILPLIAAHPAAPRPDDVPGRVAVERDLLRERLGAVPVGLIPAAGAVTPALFDGFQSMGLAWAATGEYAGSTTAWAATEAVALVPFRPAQTFGRELSAEALGLDNASDPMPRVVDESDGLVPEGSLLRLLEGLASQRPHQGWATVSESLKEWRPSIKPAAAVRAWPTWTGGLEPWTTSAASRLAWRLYGQAALGVERYQNSGSADLKALESATEELYAAQASRFYRDLPPGESEAAGKKLRAHLVAVYRKLKQTAPEDLFALASRPKGAALGDAPESEEQSTDVHFSQGAGWLAIENPAGSFGRAPTGVQLDDGSPAAALWKLDRLRVESSEAGLTFTYKLAKLDPGPAAEPAPGVAPEMGRLLLETYIDLNHVPGAGSSKLLSEPGAFIQTRDGWEYALTISGWGAFLYRSNSLGSPLQLAKLSVSVDAPQREVRVHVPGSLLRGNPMRWGYLVTASAADPATAAKPPVKALKLEQGLGILGLLGPLEQQKTLAEPTRGAPPRLSAVRARTQALQ